MLRFAIKKFEIIGISYHCKSQRIFISAPYYEKGTGLEESNKLSFSAEIG